MALWSRGPCGLWVPFPLASPRAWSKLRVLSKGITQDDNMPEMLAGHAQSLGVMRRDLVVQTSGESCGQQHEDSQLLSYPGCEKSAGGCSESLEIRLGEVFWKSTPEAA